ncbi:hypothetical protein TK90_2861 (plasmid) [Thioalkalivibrio sp. K90mix]|nr:hypothetical protein TK90_2861 [Thioalkalivibrio sp. K90mix]
MRLPGMDPKAIGILVGAASILAGALAVGVHLGGAVAPHSVEHGVVPTIPDDPQAVPDGRLPAALDHLEVAHTFAPDHNTPAALVRAGALRSVPESVDRLEANVELKSTGIFAHGMSESECRAYSPAGMVDQDTGDRGFQCWQDNDRYTLIYRGRSIPPEHRGYWIWEADQETAGGFSRIKLTGDPDLRSRCPDEGQHVSESITVSGSQVLCIPAFRHETKRHSDWGAYYPHDTPATIKLATGGQKRVIEIQSHHTP